MDRIFEFYLQVFRWFLFLKKSFDTLLLLHSKSTQTQQLNRKVHVLSHSFHELESQYGLAGLYSEFHKLQSRWQLSLGLVKAWGPLPSFCGCWQNSFPSSFWHIKVICFFNASHRNREGLHSFQSLSSGKSWTVF